MARTAGPRPVRLHGFQRPLAGTQYVVWALVWISLLVFAALGAPPLRGDANLLIASCAAYAVFYAVATLAFFHASLVDPGVVKDGERGDRIKHCWVCNKHVRGFDHHCPYLNVCIGENNYWSFFTLTTATLAGFTLQLVLAVYVFAVVYPSQFDADANATTATTAATVVAAEPIVSLAGVVLLSVGTVVPFIGWWSIVILFVFHIYLFFRGMTTLEWIMEQRKKKHDKALRKEEVEATARQEKRDSEKELEETARRELGKQAAAKKTEKKADEAKAELKAEANAKAKAEAKASVKASAITPTGGGGGGSVWRERGGE